MREERLEEVSLRDEERTRWSGRAGCSTCVLDDAVTDARTAAAHNTVELLLSLTLAVFDLIARQAQGGGGREHTQI